MKSATSKLQKECDTLLQQIGKKKFSKCEICNGVINCLHHFHPKSVSSALRYDWDNLIPICQGCHMRHYQARDPIVHGTVIENRGQEWYDALLKRRYRETIKVNVEYYRKVKERLEGELAELSTDIVA